MRRWTIPAVIAMAVLLAVLALSACTPTSTQPGQPSATTSTPSTPSSTASTAPSPTATKVYTAVLDSLNGSGVSGMATVTVTSGPSSESSGTSGMSASQTAGGGETVRVQVTALHLVPDQMHAMHIHGLSDGQASVCPSTTGSTITSEPVAEKSYGPVIAPLEPFPTASSSGTVMFDNVVSIPASVTATSLEGRAFVMHGLMVNGTYNPGVPVTCGVLHLVPASSPGASGAGTTSPPASESSEPTRPETEKDTEPSSSP